MPLEEKVYLVYVRTMGKACPQKWFGDQTTGTGKAQLGKENLLFIKELDKWDKNLSLDDLIEKYPYKETGNG